MCGACAGLVRYHGILALLFDEQWQSPLELTLVQANRPCFNQWWTLNDLIWRESFREFVKTVLDSMSPAACDW